MIEDDDVAKFREPVRRKQHLRRAAVEEYIVALVSEKARAFDGPGICTQSNIRVH